jgi:hypothetical protein
MEDHINETLRNFVEDVASRVGTTSPRANSNPYLMTLHTFLAQQYHP